MAYAGKGPARGSAKSENWSWAEGVGPFVEANRNALDNWIKVNETLANGLLALSQEMLRFAQSRFQEDVEANVALARCQSPSELFACQRRFTERATAQYFEAASKLSTLMARMTSESVAPAVQAMGSGIHAGRAD